MIKFDSLRYWLQLASCHKRTLSFSKWRW